MFRVYKIYCSVCCNDGTNVWDSLYDQLTYYSVWLDESVSHFTIIRIHTGRQVFQNSPVSTYLCNPPY